MNDGISSRQSSSASYTTGTTYGRTRHNETDVLSRAFSGDQLEQFRVV